MIQNNQNGRNEQTCQTAGHQGSYVLGYCFFEECQIKHAFCLLCVTKDRKIMHNQHTDKYCLGYKAIFNILENIINAFRQALEIDFPKLIFKFSDCNKLMEKNLLYKSKELINKLSYIRNKIQSIYSILFERKILLETIITQLQQNNYEIFEENMRIIKKYTRLNFEVNILRKIHTKFDLKQYDGILFLQRKNIPHLLIKLARIYSDKGLDLQKRKQFQDSIKYFDFAIERQRFKNTLNLQIIFDLKEYQKAIDCYNEVIKLDKKLSKAYDQKGNALSCLKQYEEAINCYDAAIFQDSKLLKMKQNLEYTLNYCCNDQELIQNYNELVQLCSQVSNSFKNKGDVLYVQGKYYESIQCYEDGIEQNSRINKALIRNCYYQENNWFFGDAFTYSEMVNQLTNQKYLLYVQKGKALQKLQYNFKAMNCYDQARDLEQKMKNILNQKYQFFGNSQTWTSNIINSRSFEKQNYWDYEIPMPYNQYDDMLEFAEDLDIHEVIYFYDRKIKSYSIKIKTLKKKCKALNALFQYDKLIKCCQNAIILYKDFEVTLLNKGGALKEIRQDEQAHLQFEKINRLGPKIVKFYNYKGNALASLYKFNHAIDCFHQAIEKNRYSYRGSEKQKKNEQNSYYGKGNALFHLSDYKEAIQCYDKVIFMNPNFFNIYNSKANALKILQLYNEAINCYDQSLRLDPKDSIAYRNKGVVLANLKIYNEAIICQNIAICLKQNSELDIACRSQLIRKI